MSVYYYVICKDHKERVDAASYAAGGPCQLGDSIPCLAPFLIWHAGCNIHCVSEYHEDEAYGDDFLDWEESNYKALFDRQKEG